MKITVEINNGRLADHPFPVLLHALYMHGAEGTLTLIRAGKTKTLYFEKGIPIHVESDISSEKLDHFLVEKEAITQEESVEALRKSIEQGRTLGEVLIADGLLEPFELYKCLRQIFARSILDVYRWEEGEFSWRDGESLADSQLRLKMNPAQLNLMGIENFTPNEVVSEIFSPTETDSWVLSPRSPYPMEHLKFNPKETRLITLLRQPQTLEELVRDSGMEPPLLRKKLYSLELLEIIGAPRPGNRSVASAESESPLTTPAEPARVAETPVAPMESGPSLETLKEVIEDASERMSSNYFEFFDVTKETPTEAVQEAYFRFAHLTNPAALPGSADPALRQKACGVFLHGLKAFQTITDPLRRTNYLNQIDAPKRLPDGQPIHAEPPKKKPGAAFAIKTGLLKGEEHLKNGLKALEEKRFPKAVEFFQFAWDVEPNPLHHAYLAYAQFMVNPMRTYEDTIETFEKILKKHPDHEVVNYLMAQAYRQMGDSDQAIRRLKEVMRINPTHVSANREVVAIRKEAEEKSKKKRRFFA